LKLNQLALERLPVTGDNGNKHHLLDLSFFTFAAVSILVLYLIVGLSKIYSNYSNQRYRGTNSSFYR
jgi:hypothetical protein